MAAGTAACGRGVRVPFLLGDTVVFTEGLYAVFVDHAQSFPEQGSRATLFSLKVASELLREDVRSSMLSLRRYLDAAP